MGNAVRADHTVPHREASVDDAAALARRLLLAGEAELTASERRRRERLGRLVADPDGRELLFSLTDQVLRIDDHRRAASRFSSIVGRPRGPVAPTCFPDHGLPLLVSNAVCLPLRRITSLFSDNLQPGSVTR